MNGRAIETFLSINPPTPKLARSALMKNNRLLYSNYPDLERSFQSLKTYNRREAPIVKYGKRFLYTGSCK